MLKIVVFLSLIFFAQTISWIPVLKIVMSHVRKYVTYGVILISHQFSILMSFPGGPGMADW